MTIKFCPKCKNILIPEKVKENNFVLRCHYCGFSKKSKGNLIEKDVLPKKEKKGTKISKEENEFATYPHKCGKCGFNKAQVIDLGIQYSDEDNLILLKCGKCGWSERVGKKVS